MTAKQLYASSRRGDAYRLVVAMFLCKFAFLLPLLMLTPAPASAVGFVFNIGGDLGGATVGGFDYTGGNFLFSIGGETDNVEAAVGRPWQWQLQGEFTQLYASDAGMDNFVYAQLDTPLLLYSGDGPLPHVGLALPNGTKLLEFADASLADLDLGAEASFNGLRPTYFDTSLTFTTDQGNARLLDEPISYSYAAGSDLPIPVPEPETWALLATGFAAVGYAVRRRRLLAAELPERLLGR